VARLQDDLPPRHLVVDVEDLEPVEGVEGALDWP
jgi:hypothetical protein